MVQFDEHILQMGWFNHQLITNFLDFPPWIINLAHRNITHLKRKVIWTKAPFSGSKCESSRCIFGSRFFFHTQSLSFLVFAWRKNRSLRRTWKRHDEARQQNKKHSVKLQATFATWALKTSYSPWIEQQKQLQIGEAGDDIFFVFGARPIFTGDLLVSGSANITSSPSTQEGRTVLWLNDTWWTPFVLGCLEWGCCWVNVTSCFVSWAMGLLVVSLWCVY